MGCWPCSRLGVSPGTTRTRRGCRSLRHQAGTTARSLARQCPPRPEHHRRRFNWIITGWERDAASNGMNTPSHPCKTCKGLQGAEPVQSTVATQWFATEQVKDHKGFYSPGIFIFFFLNTWTLLTRRRGPPSFFPLFFFFSSSISSLNSTA